MRAWLRQVPRAPATVQQAVLQPYWLLAGLQQPQATQLQPPPGPTRTAMSSPAGTIGSNELLLAAKLARLSGLCYTPQDRLGSGLAAERLALQDQGYNSFTRWYVADGDLRGLDAAEELAASQRRSQEPQRSSSRQGTAASHSDSDSSSSSSSDSSDECLAREASPGHHQQQQQQAAPQRVIMCRGVAWNSEQTQALQLWQRLARFWPAPFAAQLTMPPEAVRAHAGIADMAVELYDTLRPHLQGAVASGQQVLLGGHSLGGALALLVACRAQLELQPPPGRLACTSFGSPPVLMHGKGVADRDLLEVIGLSKDAVRSYVLDNDPIPRAMLSVDPTFSAVKQWTGVRQLLELRQWFVGEGTRAPLMPQTFLYDNVGQVLLIRWSLDGGHKVTPLSPSQVEEQMQLAVSELMQRPQAALMALLDHFHGSYAQELAAAAAEMERSSLH